MVRDEKPLHVHNIFFFKSIGIAAIIIRPSYNLKEMLMLIQHSSSNQMKDKGLWSDFSDNVE